MKNLFISSGNSAKGIGSIVKKQGESLQRAGLQVDFFTIKGQGIGNYIKAIPQIRKVLLSNSYDIVHAHYSFSGFAAALSFSNVPLVVSLMGSDAKKKGLLYWLTHFFHRYFWDATIVKSESMKTDLKLENCKIIPNGVDFDLFKPTDRKRARQELNLDPAKKYIAFAANPERFEKNFILLEKSVKYISDHNIEILIINNIDHEKVPIYFNASNVLALPSLWEGSPNVVKEAMACNLPVVSTDVGDVREVLSGTNGCYIARFDPVDFSKKLRKVLDFNKPTNGWKNIKHLNEKLIAEKIIGTYKSLLNMS